MAVKVKEFSLFNNSAIDFYINGFVHLSHTDVDKTKCVSASDCKTRSMF